MMSSTIATVVALLGVATSASAAGVATVNRGACMSQITPDLKPYQAPGQTGAGPFTIVNDQHHHPPSFDGAVGCAR